MPFRQPPPPYSDSDAAGRARYTDFEASRDRVRRRLAATHATPSNIKRLRLRWLSVAAALLLFCFLGGYFLQPVAYAQLAADYRSPVATDELSTTRAVTSEAEALPVATAIGWYHQGRYDQAAKAFAALAQQENNPNQQLFIFYHGTSEWLGRKPLSAIKTLEPLLQQTPPAHLRYRTISYVLAMAYIDNKEFSKAIPLLNKLSEKEDGMGQRASKMLGLLP